MRRLRAWWQRMLGIARDSSREREMADEIESHIQMQAEENERAGMSAQEARRRAILKLGGVERTRQAYRERDRLPLLENLLQDLRFAFRQLAKNPGFAVTAVLILTLGIAASVALFAFVDAALLKPLISRAGAPGKCGPFGVIGMSSRPGSAGTRLALLRWSRSGAAGWAGSARRWSAASRCRSPLRLPYS
jgi:hypothetical protein